MIEPIYKVGQLLLRRDRKPLYVLIFEVLEITEHYVACSDINNKELRSVFLDKNYLCAKYIVVTNLQICNILYEK